MGEPRDFGPGLFHIQEDTVKETAKQRAQRLQEARDAAAEVAEPKMIAWKVTNHDFLVFRKRYVRSCKLHDEESCVLCLG